jgi:two-component sensor histidine kinase
MIDHDLRDLRRERADDELATMGQRLENLARAQNALYASRAAGDLPTSLFEPAVEALRAAQRHLALVQRIDALNYQLDFDDDVEVRAAVRDQLADLADRHAGDPELVRRIGEGR